MPQPTYDVAAYLRRALPTFPPLACNRVQARTDHANATPEDYASVGDSLYFTARVTFLENQGTIAFFLAQQAIENYLKGLLKHLGFNTMLTTHNLEIILDRVRNHTQETFFHSDECLAIIRFFNPFNEIPRYPVQMTRHQTKGYAFLYPDSIFFLDHFVKEFRDFCPVPAGRWNLIAEGVPFQMAIAKSSNSLDQRIIELFRIENVNFS